jgi:hypothetical protein
MSMPASTKCRFGRHFEKRYSSSSHQINQGTILLYCQWDTCEIREAQLGSEGDHGHESSKLPKG